MGLKDKVAVVTGGANGIGAFIVRELVSAGAKVAITDVDRQTGAEMAAEIRRGGGEAAFFEHDVTNWDSCFTMVGAVEEQLGPIEILVNNAGVSGRVPFLELNEGEWDRLIDINLKGQFQTARAAIPGMVQRNYGRVVNMSSVCGKQGQAGFSHYCTSKFGVIGLTQSMAMEFAKTGITVNAVCPGIVATPLHDQILADMAKAADRTLAETTADFNAIVPQGRAQTGEDVARMILFLVSDAARNMTGGSYHVDGGVRME